MQAELHARLEQLGEDLRSGRIDRAALFWLKVFADTSAPEGQLRSDRWVDAGLEVVGLVEVERA